MKAIFLALLMTFKLNVTTRFLAPAILIEVYAENLPLYQGNFVKGKHKLPHGVRCYCAQPIGSPREHTAFSYCKPRFVRLALSTANRGVASS